MDYDPISPHIFVGSHPTTAGDVDELKAAGISSSCIGEVLGPGRGVNAFENGKPATWPHFDADEITRLYQRRNPAESI